MYLHIICTYIFQSDLPVLCAYQRTEWHSTASLLGDNFKERGEREGSQVEGILASPMTFVVWPHI